VFTTRKRRMKFLRIAITSAGIALLLTACSQSPNVADPSGSIPTNNQEVSSKSVEWESDQFLSAGTVASELIRAGVCDTIIDNSGGAYGSDLDENSPYALGAFVICMTEYPQRSDENCPANVYVTAGPDATLYDPERSLSYEDGMSVALLYGENYQVEISPLLMDDSETVIELCASKVSAARSLIGGSMTVYGQYDSVPEEVEPEAPSVDYVSMPNLVGSIDGSARNWLSNNGYDFSFDIKSTGYNPQISCLMSGDNIIVDQSPLAGSEVENSFNTRVVVYVNCEW
jgi:hypothetical protein